MYSSLLSPRTVACCLLPQVHAGTRESSRKGQCQTSRMPRSPAGVGWYSHGHNPCNRLSLTSPRMVAAHEITLTLCTEEDMFYHEMWASCSTVSCPARPFVLVAFFARVVSRGHAAPVRCFERVSCPRCCIALCSLPRCRSCALLCCLTEVLDSQASSVSVLFTQLCCPSGWLDVGWVLVLLRRLRAPSAWTSCALVMRARCCSAEEIRSASFCFLVVRAVLSGSGGNGSGRRGPVLVRRRDGVQCPSQHQRQGQAARSSRRCGVRFA